MADRPPPFVIAIDGPAASGKSTLARRVSSALDLAYLNTGLLYRAVALSLLRQGADPADRKVAASVAADLVETGFDPDDPGLRRESTGNAAGVIASYVEVRGALQQYQRNFASNPPHGARGAVLDGRDIGTVICPAADVKIFVDADPQERLRRRAKELRNKGEEPRMQRVLTDMKERDQRDRTRDAAPLVPATDAEVLDSTDLGADAVFSKGMAIIQPKWLEWRRIADREQNHRPLVPNGKGLPDKT